MARNLPVENLLPRMWGQLSTTCSNVLQQPNWELLVAVNHNQLRTMASKTVDPIDWSHTPPSWAVPPERLVYSINQCSRNRTCNRSMRGNPLAYAATQGILLLLLLLLLKNIGNARTGEGDWHSISPKTPAPHYQSIEEKKRKGK